MKYIKKFESFDAKPVSKELSNVYKSAIENRFATLDSSSTDTEEVIIAPPKPKEPITRPWRPVPTQKPDPGTKERPMGMMKTYEEFRMGGEVETAPVTAPPTTTTTTTPTPGDCFCYTISNETAGTLLYSYTDCGSTFVRAPINADTISIVCSSTVVTGDAGLIITGGITSCTNSEDCAV